MPRYYAGEDVMRQTPLHPLSTQDLQAVADLKTAGQAFFDLVDSQGPSREASVAKTKIEEAVMWAVKGISS